MKSFFLSLVAAVFVVTTAVAADLGGTAKADESLEGIAWPDGISVGVSGTIFGSTTLDPAQTIIPLGADHMGMSAHLGYDLNVDNSRFVVGVEAVYGMTDLDVGILGNVESSHFELGGRLGYLFTASTLGYVGAAYRWAEYEFGSGTNNPSIDVNGIVLKVGMEQQLTEKFSVFAEGSKFYGETDTQGWSANVDAPEFKLGGKYRF